MKIELRLAYRKLVATQLPMKIALLPALLFFTFHSSFAQQWNIMGNESQVAAATSSFTAITVLDDVPYVVYREGNTAGKVKRKNPATGAWEQVGDHIGTNVTYTRIYLDRKNNLFVTYVDAANGNKLAVRTYNPETDSWEPLDNNSANLYVSTGSVNNNVSQYSSTPRSSLAFDSDNNPYIAFGDGSNLTPFVKKFDGSSWVTVGSGAVNTAARAVGVSLVIDEADVPWLVYISLSSVTSTTGNMALYRYSSGSWTPVTVTIGGIRHTSMALNSAGNLAIAYFNTGNSNRATVIVYNKTTNTWSSTTSLSSRDAPNISLISDQSGNLYCSFIDGIGTTFRSVARVFKQNTGTTTWRELKDPAVTTGIDEPVGNLTIGIGGDTSRPFIVYTKTNSGGVSTPIVRMFLPPASPATITTIALSNITPGSAEAGGNITSDGGSPITERGVVYGPGVNPTTANNKVVDAAGGTGSFTVTLDGLTPATFYYVRAYAINAGGTTYGENVRLNSHAQPDPVVTTPKQMEFLTRGLVAVRRNSSSVYVGWRLLGNDPSSIAFNLYRDGLKLNDTPITGSTNFLDNTSTNGSYTVKAVTNGVEGAASAPASVWTNNQLSIPLQIPAGGTTPDGQAYTYSANDASVGDVDGDGEYEIILRWEPSVKNDNAGGYSGNQIFDCYKLDGTRLWRIDLGHNMPAGPHYNPFMVYDFDGDGKAEMILKTADGTVDGTGTVIGNPAVDYRNSGGWVHAGPEYLTVFNGLTGAAMATVNFEPARGNISDWGDNYGNRADRFVSAVAYLDGARPSLVVGRGYYNKLVRAAYDWRNGQLTLRWKFDSKDPADPANDAYSGQGNHQMTIGDVDGDGKDEVINGSSAINDDGKRLWTYRNGHGDALHLTDLHPDRPGQEIWINLESPGDYAPYGLRQYDAKTGETIWGVPTTGDVGRSLAADVDPAHKGYEMWGSSGNLYNAKGEQIGTSKPTNGSQAVNSGIWWDGDLGRELLDGTIMDKWNPATKSLNRLFTIYQAAPVSSNNSTKKNPSLQADLLGDWREEILLRRTDNTALILFTTITPTEHRIHTLMHDPQYRTAIAWQNSGYNQPPYPSFYLGYDMPAPPTPNIAVVDIVPPVVSGIVRQEPSGVLTNRTNVTYRVTFSEGVNGLDVSDVVLTATGNVTGNVASVTAISNAVYDVAVDNITGDGTLRLDVNSSNTGITDGATNALSEGFEAGEVYTFDHTVPTLAPVIFVSNNAKPHLAKEGDVVTLNFTSSESILNIEATIAGLPVQPTALGNNQYRAAYTLTGTDDEGIVAFTIQFKDEAGNEGIKVSATTDAGTVTYDRTKPTLPSVVVSSNNANPAFAKEGDILTLNFTASESIEAIAVTIAGHPVVPAAGASNSYTASYTLTATDAEGPVSFTIDFSDPSGNTGMQVINTTNGQSIIYDRTGPLITKASVNKSILPVPNHKMEDIIVRYEITELNPGSVVLSVSSNEPEDGLGDGDTGPDWEIVDGHHVRLRAERSGTGNGRIYTITITATDLAGNVSTQTLTVSVPPNRNPNVVTANAGASMKEMVAERFIIMAYPNPAPQAFHINIQTSSSNPIELIVVDGVGRVIERKTGVAANSNITIGEKYQPGIYFIQATQGNKRMTLKLVKGVN